MPILSSTFFLTLLLMVGLFFFIRASVKDRTEQVQLISEVPKTSLLEQLKDYFKQRAYNVTSSDAAQDTMTFEGLVRPSWFLAIFLSILAASGFFCLILVLSFLYPALTPLFFALELLSPIAGIFYWKKARRMETVSFSLENLNQEGSQPGSILTLTAHRDEVIQLKQTFPLKSAN
ncbi:MAG: cofactor assembly of complex C subunit B [Crocosphaera sp.]|uniref:cofactor assembly of complex C subunit B n=1 Tax=Crocosphaera sp. TaxID=2729996 RepID=UPI00258DE1D1|nr:cofactor assembly of complex C subunit B [Crocosphaera sp.]MCH2244009.1 cofactor assembly of complex C subunit B [Crocosphaera sp.]